MSDTTFDSAADPAVVAAVLAELRGPAPTFDLTHVNPLDAETQLAQVVAHARHQGHDVPDGSYNDNLAAVAIAFGLDPRNGAANLPSICGRLGIYVAGVRQED